MVAAWAGADVGCGIPSLGRCRCWVWYTLYHVVCRVGDTSSYFEPRVRQAVAGKADALVAGAANASA